MTTTIQVPDMLPYTLLVLIVISMFCFVLGFCGILRYRIRAFSAVFMQRFEEEHKEKMGDSSGPKGGFPDTGNGYFGRHLDYKPWFEYATAMRIHGNFLEFLPLIITMAIWSTYG